MATYFWDGTLNCGEERADEQFGKGFTEQDGSCEQADGPAAGADGLKQSSTFEGAAFRHQQHCPEGIQSEQVRNRTELRIDLFERVETVARSNRMRSAPRLESGKIFEVSTGFCQVEERTVSRIQARQDREVKQPCTTVPQWSHPSRATY